MKIIQIQLSPTLPFQVTRNHHYQIDGFPPRLFSYIYIYPRKIRHIVL